MIAAHYLPVYFTEGNVMVSREDALRKKVMEAVRNAYRLDGMRRAFQTDVIKQRKVKDLISDLEGRRERARKVRELCLNDPSWLEMAIERLEGNGIRVIVAETAAEACQIVLEELEGEKLLVKSKSNITKEIGLTPFLESQGIRVIETDAGDRIVQLSGKKPVHPTGPAANFTRYDVAKLLSEHLGREVAPDPGALTMAIREEIASCIARAKVGLTGANFIAAEEGSIIIIHNEGNVSLCARRPEKYIVVSAMEKIVPDLESAMNLVKLQTYYATGSLNTSFIDVISAPSRTADIEKQMFYGMHPPSEIVLILVDGGRSGITDREMMYCINCGACLLKCPVYDIMGEEFGGHAYLGGRGLCFEAALDGSESAVEGGITFCTHCGLCQEMCPVKIDTPRLVRETREKAMKESLLPLSGQKEALENVEDHGHPWSSPAEERAEWARDLDLPKRGEVLYFAGCFPSMRFSEVLRASIELLRAGGIEVAYLGEGEVCCGSPIYKMGATGLFEKLARRNFDAFRKAGARKIITSCPGCFNMLSRYGEHIDGFDIEVEHITQVMAGLIDKEKIRFKPAELTVTYHDPCDLGRHAGVYEEPRKVLDAVPHLKRREMEFTREMAVCCGAGGGVKKAHPELATAISRRRLESAAETGAEILITPCPFCCNNFRDALKDGGINIDVREFSAFLSGLIEK